MDIFIKSYIILAPKKMPIGFMSDHTYSII